MTEKTPTKGHKAAMVVLIGTSIVLIGGICVMWSWNTLAVDLFQAPAMKFRHALAAELLVGSITAIIGLGARLFSGHRRSHGV